MEKHKTYEEACISILNIFSLDKWLSIMNHLSVNISGKTLQEIKDDLKISHKTTDSFLNNIVIYFVMSKMKDIKLANGSNALRDICISSDGNYIYVSHNLGRYTVPTSQLQQGWMNTSALCYRCKQTKLSWGIADGMNWDLMNDGIGNSKNCKSMLFSHLTASCIGKKLSKKDIEALTEYVNSL